MPFHHFQESEFATLSGARVVRVAVHPEMQHMGYGSRAIDQLVHYYQGELTEARTGAKAAKPRANLRRCLRAAEPWRPYVSRASGNAL